MLKEETKENLKQIGSNAAESLKDDLKKVDPSLVKNPAVLLVVIIAGIALSRELSIMIPALIVVAIYVVSKSNSSADLAKAVVQVPMDIAESVKDKIKSKKQQSEQSKSQEKPQEIVSPEKK